jgi:hypothetical protein
MIKEKESIVGGISLTLEKNDRTIEQLSTFEHSLQPYGLKIVEQLENEAEETIELIVNADFTDSIREVTNLAFDCFRDALISFRKIY